MTDVGGDGDGDGTDFVYEVPRIPASAGALIFDRLGGC